MKNKSLRICVVLAMSWLIVTVNLRGQGTSIGEGWWVPFAERMALVEAVDVAVGEVVMVEAVGRALLVILLFSVRCLILLRLQR
jgi:hypothetical protein